jgi:leucyl aminopeptidase
MLDHLIDDAPDAVPVLALSTTALEAWLKGAPASARAWVENTGFRAEPGSVSLVPGEAGALTLVLAGTGEEPLGLWSLAGLPARLPERAFRLESPDNAQSDAAFDGEAAGKATFGWAMGVYDFTRYKEKTKPRASLVWPEGVDRAAVASAIAATGLVRDLVNTPAEHMGPEELAEAARNLARAHKAKFAVTVGEDLLKKNYPAIHAVGRASERAPRLIDFVWGDADGPKVTLVGKGVCFDSGGLDLKPAAGMKTMKKDMGGAAHVLGLAAMIMEAGLKLRLRVLIPAVENSVSGNALRPLDVVTTRLGKTVEIGNTDAEGRVVLADALAEAASENPALIVDFATLTGAARVALGPELQAMFTNDDPTADTLIGQAHRQEDPLWRMPLWKPYRKMIEAQTANITNAAPSPHAGAITAALFLQEFVSPGIPWVHLDVMAWNPAARPGRPEGGEATGMRAAFAAIAARFGG